MKLISARLSVALATALLTSLPAWSGPAGPGQDSRSARRVSSSVAQGNSEAARTLGQDATVRPKVLGRTYGELAADWVSWSEAGPKGQNAMQDTTGAFCAANQPARDIWFLAGTLQGTPVGLPVVRHCTIPRGRALFYPILVGGWIDCPNTPDETTSDADVREAVAFGFTRPTELSSTLNGVPIVNLQVPIVRTQSPAFTSVLPNNSVQAEVCAPPLAAGRTGRRIADGYWVMLPPLPPGQHVLDLRGAWLQTPSIPVSFETSVTYVLTVQGRH